VNTVERVARHFRLTARNYGHGESAGPPFLILFINSICNQTCEHCFYWRNLNAKDDLTVEELRSLSEELGNVETLNLSGGEPFLRKEFGEICRFFIRNNKVRQIYVPTNGTFKDKTIAALEEVFREPSLDLFAVELSLDGMPDFHDSFRGMKNGFARSMETYDALAEMQKTEPRLRIHAISTATSTNLDQIRQLTSYLVKRCPAMDHHNLALIRGDRKNASLEGPALEEYGQLYRFVQSEWAKREEGRYGAIVEPMLQYAKTRTAQEKRQVVPCRAGTLNAVIYANGDVSLCETHAPIGNLRQSSFRQIWNAEAAWKLRDSIANGDCYCTNEVFLWPSIVFQPTQLVKILYQSKPWKKAEPADTFNAPPSPPASDPPVLRVL
jgi:MoaA/NifB/PqqE/SkfB family radical SAM enzyme